MMLELPEGLQGIGYLEGLDLYLWYIVCVLLFAGGIIFFVKATRAETPVQRTLFLGYGLFSACYGVTRVLYILAVKIPDQYDEFTIGGYIFGMAAFTFMIRVIEGSLLKDILKTRGIFTIISFGMLIIAFLGLFGIIERYAFLYILYGVIIADGIILLFLYLFLIVKTTGNLRMKTTLSFLGILLIFAGLSMDSELFLSTFQFPLVIPPIVHVVGLALFGLAQLRD